MAGRVCNPCLWRGNTRMPRQHTNLAPPWFAALIHSCVVFYITRTQHRAVSRTVFNSFTCSIWYLFSITRWPDTSQKFTRLGQYKFYILNWCSAQVVHLWCVQIAIVHLIISKCSVLMRVFLFMPIPDKVVPQHFFWCKIWRSWLATKIQEQESCNRCRTPRILPVGHIVHMQRKHRILGLLLLQIIYEASPSYIHQLNFCTEKKVYSSSLDKVSNTGWAFQLTFALELKNSSWK